jgi:hypothetical protein
MFPCCIDGECAAISDDRSYDDPARQNFGEHAGVSWTLAFFSRGNSHGATGAISSGLLNVPVQLYSGERSVDLSFG